jgi:endo-1,4-beta-xylanase
LLIVLPTLIACKKNLAEPVQQSKMPEVVQPHVPDQKIKELASFKIGAAVKGGNIKSEMLYDQVLKGEFNQITAEYEMKMNQIWTSENVYNFNHADYLVNYAVQNNMSVHGHTLLWYASFPTWLKDANYDTVAFENKVRGYITAVVGRYKGKIRSWDVANEVFNDDGTLRVESQMQGKFRDPVGFIGRCHQLVHEIDPGAKLFYNDYNVVLASGKRNAMKNMALRFKASGIPIDGLGEQFHYRIATSQASINSGFADLASSGLLIHISEIDCKVNIDNSNTYVFSDTDKQKQSNFFKNIVSLYKALPSAQKFAITLWGITDKYTWLRDSNNGNREYPLLFDENYNKKLAYNGFLEGLK